MDNSKNIIRIDLNTHNEVFSQWRLAIDDREYTISPDILESMSRYLGLGKSLYSLLKSEVPSRFVDLFLYLSNHYANGYVNFLVNEEESVVTGFSFQDTEPLLCEDFVRLIESFSEDAAYVMKPSFSYKDEDSNTANVLLDHVSNYECDNVIYDSSVLLSLLESGKVVGSKIFKKEDLTILLPSEYLKFSYRRYLKEGVTAKEALNTALLKLAMLMDDKDKWYEDTPYISNHISSCKLIPLSYEECIQARRSLLSSMLRSNVETKDSDERIASFDKEFMDFAKYNDPEGNCSSYVWRCSAVSDKRVYDLALYISSFANSGIIYPEESYELLGMVGDLIMKKRIAPQLAKQNVVEGKDS